MTRRRRDGRFYVDERDHHMARADRSTGGAINGNSRAPACHDSQDNVARNREVGVICCIGYILIDRA